MDDIKKGTLDLDEEEQEKRRQDYIWDVVNAKPPQSYHIDNVFQLTSEVTNSLSKLRDSSQINDDTLQPRNLLCYPLEIEQVYIAPQRLITGLVTRLQENWLPLVTSYNKLVKKDEVNKLDDLHYYIEFCWLAWGPSVSTISLLNEGSKDDDFMVVQAAFGDEANSVNLIMKIGKWRLLEKDLMRNQNSYSGWPVCLKNVIIVNPGKDAFFEKLRNHSLFRDVLPKIKIIKAILLSIYHFMIQNILRDKLSY